MGPVGVGSFPLLMEEEVDELTEPTMNLRPLRPLIAGVFPTGDWNGHGLLEFLGLLEVSSGRWGGGLGDLNVEVLLFVGPSHHSPSSPRAEESHIIPKGFLPQPLHLFRGDLPDLPVRNLFVEGRELTLPP